MSPRLAVLDPRAHRRMRLIWPFAVLLAVIGATLGAHASQQPDLRDPAYLDPAASDGIGGDRLAAALRARDIPVVAADTSETALDLLRQTPGATLFVPAPSFVDLQSLSGAGLLPSGTRIVVAGAEARDLERTGWTVTHAGTRWATGVTGADCPIPLPGPAAVLRHRYASPDGTVCFGGGLATYTEGPVTVVLVGAADPFRNDRIGEHANELFATTVLGGSRVVWLELHDRENAAAEPEPSDSASGSPLVLPTETDDAPGPVTPPPGAGEEDAPPQAGGAGPAGPPLTDAFPDAFWATVALAALALLAFAAAAARRLGVPVPEPLPSRVPAHETMLGHARLYQRARARGPSLDILRAAARRRLAEHLGLPRDASLADLADRAGLPPEHVRRVLGGDPPATDAQLVTAAQNVQKLVREVMHPEGEPS